MRALSLLGIRRRGRRRATGVPEKMLRAVLAAAGRAVRRHRRRRVR
jgi:hypothetical protein